MALLAVLLDGDTELKTISSVIKNVKIDVFQPGNRGMGREVYRTFSL